MSEPSSELRERCRAWMNDPMRMAPANVEWYSIALARFVQAEIDRAVAAARINEAEYIAGLAAEFADVEQAISDRVDGLRALAQKEQPK